MKFKDWKIVVSVLSFLGYIYVLIIDYVNVIFSYK